MLCIVVASAGASAWMDNCNSCGVIASAGDTRHHNQIVCGTYRPTPTYKCDSCGAVETSGGTHYKPYTYYSINCGKTAGSKSYTRTVTTYRCNTCGKSFVYKPAANSGSCAYCGSSHSASASGSTTGTHNAVTKYLICAYK